MLHARLSPSGADRWMNCPGSIRLSEGLADTTSVYAAEGTVAHTVRSDCLELGFDARHLVGHSRTEDGFTFPVDEAMADYLQPGIDWLREQPGEMFVEHRVDMGRWIPDGFGTLDCGIVGPRYIIIDDLKYGRLPVYPKSSRQLMTYALGFWDQVARHLTDATEFLISIDQPRAAGGGKWLVTLDELLAFGEELKAAAARTADPRAPLHAGEKQCRYCPLITDRTEDTPPPEDADDGEGGTFVADVARSVGRPGCSEHDRFILDLIQVDPKHLVADEIPLRPGSLLTAEQRAGAARHRPMIRTWIDRIHDDVAADAKAGRPTPGAKLVDGRAGKRIWTDPEAAEKAIRPVLGEKAFKNELLSVAQAEKALTGPKAPEGAPAAWAAAQKHQKSTTTKPQIVALDDPRPSIQSVEQQFDDIV